MNTPLLPFDRILVRRHRDRASRTLASARFLFEEAASMLVDRLRDIVRTFPTVLILGDHDGVLAEQLQGMAGIETVIHTDLSPHMVAEAKSRFTQFQNPAASAPSYRSLFAVVDEETLPFAPAQFDLVVCPLSLHWVNDLPGTLAQIHNILKPDGLFLANMLGGETLTQLRQAWMDAEMQSEGGAGVHVSPFADLLDMAALLQRAGYALPVADSDTLTVTYADALALMRDLKAMGESNAVYTRRKTMTRRETLAAVCACYYNRFANANQRIEATFQILSLIGWAPAPSQPKPLRPGSATMPLSAAIVQAQRSNK